MKRTAVFRRSCALLLASAFSLLAFSALSHSVFAEGAEAYKWSVQYLIDQSQRVADRPQTNFPRRNRALAISPDNRFLYAGYNRSADGAGEVRKIDLSVPDYETATLRVLHNVLPKALAVDADGRVYIAAGEDVRVYDANLRKLLGTIDTMSCEGVAVTKEGADFVLYGSERGQRMLRRFVIEVGDGGSVSGRPAGLSGNGELPIPGAISLRGVCVDSKGRVLIADVEANKVFRVDKDGKTVISGDVQTPIALACDGVKIFVTQNTQREISILEENLITIGTLSVPWEQLELSPAGNNQGGALGGIVVIPNQGFFVANEGGQTANQKSTYGRVDDYAGLVDGKAYTDIKNDDNEPILRAVPIGLATQ